MLTEPGKLGTRRWKKDRVVGCQVVGCKPEGLVVKLVATMFLDSPRERTTMHDEKAGAVFVSRRGHRFK